MTRAKKFVKGVRIDAIIKEFKKCRPDTLKQLRLPKKPKTGPPLWIKLNLNSEYSSNSAVRRAHFDSASGGF